MGGTQQCWPGHRQRWWPLRVDQRHVDGFAPRCRRRSVDSADEPETTAGSGRSEDSRVGHFSSVPDGLASGVLALFDTDWLGAGVGLGAAGITFGLMANALVRR